MPTYKLPPDFRPSSVEDLRTAYVEASTQWWLASGPSTMNWPTISSAIKEVLYVRGMNHEIVDALIGEWNRAGRRSAEKIKKDASVEAERQTDNGTTKK